MSLFLSVWQITTAAAGCVFGGCGITPCAAVSSTSRIYYAAQSPALSEILARIGKQ